MVGCRSDAHALTAPFGAGREELLAAGRCPPNLRHQSIFQSLRLDYAQISPRAEGRHYRPLHARALKGKFKAKSPAPNPSNPSGNRSWSLVARKKMAPESAPPPIFYRFLGGSCFPPAVCAFSVRTFCESAGGKVLVRLAGGQARVAQCDRLWRCARSLVLFLCPRARCPRGRSSAKSPALLPLRAFQQSIREPRSARQNGDSIQNGRKVREHLCRDRPIATDLSGDGPHAPAQVIAL